MPTMSPKTERIKPTLDADRLSPFSKKRRRLNIREVLLKRKDVIPPKRIW
jgi:hypothetical protein